MVVKARGAAVFHQLAHAGLAGQADDVRVEVLPDLIERLQPVEQLHILHLRQVPRKLLIEVVVRVHEARITQHMPPPNFRCFAEIRADGPDDAVFRIEVDVLQDPVIAVTHQLRDVPSRPVSAAPFCLQIVSLYVDRSRSGVSDPRP